MLLGFDLSAFFRCVKITDYILVFFCTLSSLLPTSIILHRTLAYFQTSILPSLASLPPVVCSLTLG